jgi:non-ribosomal peptide synthetase component E (peptide arylation enzyme)
MGFRYDMRVFRHTQEMIDRYIREGFWGGRGFPGIYEQNAKNYPHKEAFVDSKTRMTWAQAEKWIDRLALGLCEFGLKKDDVLATQLPNLIETALLRPSLQKCGVLELPLLMTLRSVEVEYILNLTEAVGIVIQPKFHGFDYLKMIKEIRPNLQKFKYIFVIGNEVPEEAISVDEIIRQPHEEKYPEEYLKKVEIRSGEVMTLMTSTGTTGVPKIIEYPHMLPSISRAVAWCLTRDDIIGVFSPIIAGTAATAWMTAPVIAAKIVLLERFDAEEALRLIEKENITIINCVPAQITMMVRHPNFKKYDMSSVRLMNYAGAPIPYHIAEEVENKIGCKLITHYGAAETGAPTITYPDDPPEVRRITQGRVVHSGGYELKLIDDDGNEVPQGEVGEVITRGPGVSSGYYKDPEATSAAWGREPDGWYHFGDLAKYDKSGNLTIVGRKKDMIIRGGQNIAPIEIENILITHPTVYNVSIVPMPDPVMGEKACAYVIPKQGQKLTFDEMISFIRQNKVASYKLPERLELVDRFPMTENGKILKRELTADITGKLKAEGII